MIKPSLGVRKFLYLWAPVVFYAAFIFFMSSFSFELLQRAEKNHVDKLGHIVEYSLFGVLLARAFSRHSSFWGSGKRVLAVVIFAGALYAASDEWHQSFVPGRDSTANDVVADTVGLTIGAWLWLKKQGKVHA